MSFSKDIKSKKIMLGEYEMDLQGQIYRFPQKSENTDKYIVAACAKDEGPYIREFVENYLNIGFDKIIIANNDDDQTILNEKLTEYIETNKVEILDFHGLKVFQLAFYNMIFNQGDYKWCAYVDCDEFLEISGKYANVKEMLDDVDADCLMVHWLMFGSNGKILYEDKKLKERFPIPTLPVTLKENMFVKAIVKGGIQGYFTSPHTPISEVYKMRYSYGGYGDTSDTVEQTHSPIRYKKCFLKHYYTKSLEEWIDKSRRGWPDHMDKAIIRDEKKFYILKGLEKYNEYFDSPFIFKNEEDDDYGDVLENYDIIQIKFNNERLYGLYGHMGKLMTKSREKTYVISDEILDNDYNYFLAMAFATGNYIVYSVNDNIDNIFYRYHNNKYKNYCWIYYLSK